ncbi:MAG: PIN domain-containing protein [Sedimenticola sp.]
MRYTVVFDACVLYPAPLRDFLMRLSMTGLFAAKWTDQIHDEWTRNVLKARPELEDKLPRTRKLMNSAIPDSLVTGYEPLIEKSELPDIDDRHVLAAAIHSGAQAIITFNLRGFPDNALAQYGVEAMHPDTFIEHQLDLHQGAVIAIAKQHREALKNPPKTADEYIETLAAQGLAISAVRFRDYSELI